MDVQLFVKEAIEGKQRSPCCYARVVVVYRSSATGCDTAAYRCQRCDRLHVADSRDPEPLERRVAIAAAAIEGVEQARAVGYDVGKAADVARYVVKALVAQGFVR